MTYNQKQNLISQMLEEVSNRENEFPFIDDKGRFLFPVLTKSGIREAWSEDKDHGKGKYRGFVIEVNDHGNVTVWNQFMNGTRREVASRV